MAMKSCRFEQVHDLLDGFVRPVIGGLEFGIGSISRIGFVVKAAVGQRATETLVEEKEEQRDINALGGEAVAVAGAIALKQAMTFEFSQHFSNSNQISRAEPLASTSG